MVSKIITEALQAALKFLKKGFSGELYFTYIGCQSSNVGSVTGEKKLTESGTLLQGSWQGVVDKTSQSGHFDGKLNDKGFYEGTYTVTAGKQKVVIEDCIEYYIAPKGTWFIYPVNESINASFIQVTESKVQWSSPNKAAITQCQLVDLGSEESCEDVASVIWQNVAPFGNKSLSFKDVEFVNGNQYAAACSHYDRSRKVVSFSKRVFTYPDMLGAVE